jgi:hypothetical protein
MTQKQKTTHEAKPTDSFANFISAAGVILAVSYPVLAISTGFRAIYQLFLKDGVDNMIGPLTTLVAATCYILATIGIVMQKRWGMKAWWLSVGVLGLETTLTFIVGTLSLLYPDLIGSSAWRAFGADYGYFPLVQPILGLLWLFHPYTLQAYRAGGVKQ